MNNDFDLTPFYSLLEKFPGSRPFICNGKPIKNESVFIIGYNAATKLKRDFLEDWSDRLGFDYSNWLLYYKQERKNNGKKNTLSNTRQRLEWITSDLHPLHSVETNIYNLPTSNVKKLTKEFKNSEIIEFLIKEFKPRIIVLHGLDTLKTFNKIYDLQLTLGKFEYVTLNGIQIKVKAEKHFSRGWSKVAIKNLASEVKAEL